MPINTTQIAVRSRGIPGLAHDEQHSRLEAKLRRELGDTVTLFALTVQSPQPARAGAFATEITQLLNHAQLIMQYLRQAEQLAEAVKQTTDMLKNSRVLPGQVFGEIAGQVSHLGFHQIVRFQGIGIRQLENGQEHSVQAIKADIEVLILGAELDARHILEPGYAAIASGLENDVFELFGLIESAELL